MAMRRVVVLNTGGTYSEVENDAGVLDIVPERMPEVASQTMAILTGYFPNLTIEVTTITDPEYSGSWGDTEPKSLDSSAMTPVHWNVLAHAINSIAERENEEGPFAVVVIHGTDSLAYTAAALTFMVKNRGFPIVVTGSQRPLLERRETDAIGNIVGAVAVASYQTSAGFINGVHVCFNYKIMRGVHVVKVSSVEDDAFAAPRFDPVGTVNFTSVKINTPYIARLGMNRVKTENGIFNAFDKAGAVMLIKICPGINLDFLPGVYAFGTKNLRCVLLVGLGSGNGPHFSLKAPLLVLLNAHCFVAVASDCLDGRASATYASCITNIDQRIVAVENMTTEAAYAKILVLLGNNSVQNNAAGMVTFKERMTTSWAGEYSLK